MAATAQANGAPGAVAICSSPEAAMVAAKAAAACGPTSLAVHRGLDSDLGVARATGDADALLAAMAPSADRALYRTAARPMLHHRRTWDLGTPTPGVTGLYLTRARPGLSADDYHRYWEREHGPRALRHHLGMWDYTQVSIVEALHGDPIDGVAVTQWPRDEELEDRFTDGPIGTTVIRHDASQFTDLDVLERHRMDEVVLLDEPFPQTGTIEITDARHIEFDRPPDAVWPLVGQFGALLDWWPGGFVACEVSSDLAVGMTRTLVREDGAKVVERLIEYRPDERMLQLTIDEGIPPAIRSYTCRYEVRPVGESRCRLDWYPRATVDASDLGLFDALVDRGWPMVSGGLSSAVPPG